MPNIRIKSLPPTIPDSLNMADLIDEMNESIRTVASALAGEIALPPLVTIKFGTDKKTFAMAEAGEITISPSSFEYLEDHTPEGSSIFSGIVAHELSHVSDFFSNNSTIKTRGSVAHKVIGEGKAEQVGTVIGGASYSDKLVQPLLTSERGAAYSDLLLSERKTYAAKRWAEKNLSLGPETPLSMVNGIYATGFALIEDTMKWTGSDSIFDVHARSPVYFMDALRNHLDQDTAISVLDMYAGNHET